MDSWSDEQIAQWRRQHRAYTEDAESMRHDKEVDLKRPHSQQEMMHLLHSFLDGNSTLKEFNTIFQKKSHDAWRVFQLQGTSGDLFLNKLVRHVPSEDTF